MLTVRLVGPAVFACNGTALHLQNRKAQAIIAYMALNDAPTEHRNRIADLLWSNVSPQSARTSLRQTLLELRRALAEAGCAAITTSHTAVECDHSQIRADTSDLIAAVRSGSVPDVLLSPCISDTLLSDFDDLDPSFDEWINIQRNAFHKRLLAVMTERLADASLPYSSLSLLAEAIIQLEPTHEEACRIVMLRAARAGDSAAALRTYDALWRRLDEEHDMEPSPETQDLLARIKLGEFEQKTSIITTVSATVITPPRVAVMPFRTLGPRPVPAWFADGLVEDLVCMLATLREPQVISSHTTRALRDQDVGLAKIGRDLDVRYVISGVIRPMNGALRLTVELAEAETGTVLWKQNHDTDETRLFDVQDNIVANVASLLAPRVHHAELRRVRHIRPENLGAYHLMLQAREVIFALNPDSFDQAGRLLRQAILAEPDYAPIHVALSNWCSLRLGQGWSPDRAADAAELDKAVHNALRHDPLNPHAKAMLGHNRTLQARDYQEALQLFDSALQAAPNDATVWTLSSPTFAYMGDAPEAIRRAEKALSLSPMDPFSFRIFHFLSIGHFFNGATDEAEHWGREALEANPNYTSNLRTLSTILVEQGKMTEARKLASRAIRIEPSFRVGPAMERLATFDEKRRQIYGNNLLAAGFPG